jgi:FMN phosphatase YigB (HAD superfamily)
LFLRQIRLDTFARDHGISAVSVRPDQTLLDYFDVDVSGRDFAHGKPHPEMFLTADRELGVAPAAAIVIEDAVAGIEAAKAGGMARPRACRPPCRPGQPGTGVGPEPITGRHRCPPPRSRPW